MAVRYITKDPTNLHERQLHRLGILGLDRNGYLWSYVWFTEDVSAGEYVSDLDAADIISGGVGTITTTSAAGTDLLIDSGEFAGEDIVGAMGTVLGDAVANGAGHVFHVSQMVDNDTVRVVVHASDSGPSAFGKWATSLTATNATYGFWFPGKVRQGNGLSDIIRGVAQEDVDASETPYGWVQQTGIAVASIASTQDALVVAEGMVPTTGGQFEGFSGAGTPADQAWQHFATCLIGNIASEDMLQLVNLHIENDSISYRFPAQGADYS